MTMEDNNKVSRKDGDNPKHSHSRSAVINESQPLSLKIINLGPEEEAKSSRE
jgi:hypothetical protein